MNHIEKIRSLINYLNEQTCKYNQGIADITDKEWDKLLKQLEQMEKDTGIVYSNSPTQTVGCKILSEIPKIQIMPIPMLSLKKVYSQEEINSFANKREIIGMVKCDGLSVRLIYQNGILISANSRGNGIEGGLITEHVKSFLNVPLTIPYLDTYIIDGEAIIKYNDFNIITKQEDLKNPRNAAAGSLNTLDLNTVRNRRLSFIAWDVIQGGSSNSFIENLNEAKDLGFETVYVSKIATNEEILNKAKELSIPCDGVVWRIDDIAYGKTLGQTSHHFNHAVAWKPENEFYETTLKNIEWQVGRSGQITPIAVFEPVDTGDSIIEKASLSNSSILNTTLGVPYAGQRLWVSKRNCIIPYIERADKMSEPDDISLYIPSISKCPVCGSQIIIKSDGESDILYCSNPNCEGRILNKLKYFVSKAGLNIKGLSEQTLNKLLDWGWIESAIDIFKLQMYRDDWVKKPGFGIKSVDNILNAIEASRKCDLDKFIAALGIPLIGTSASKALAKHFGTWEAFIEAVDNDFKFYTLPDFGPEAHSAIMNFDFEEACNIYTDYLTINPITSTSTSGNNILEGLTFVITGKLSLLAKNRDELKVKIESAGGKVTGSVSKNTNYLINNDVESTSSKNMTAKKLGVPIISEKKFKEIFEIS